MPRELIHWNVLERAQVCLSGQGECQIFSALRSNRAAAYLGAVAHDAPYYYRLGGTEFEVVASALHGEHGEDTLLPIFRSILLAQDRLEQEEFGVILSLVAGMLSHAATDIVFHPLVYYFTGDYNAVDQFARTNSRSRHRLLEVYLDSWIRPQYALWNEGRISRVLVELADKFPIVCEFLDNQLVPQVSASLAQVGVQEVDFQASEYRKSLQHMSLLQSVFLSDVFGLGFRLLANFFGGDIAAIDSLFSFARKLDNAVFAEPLEYLNPVSGAERSNSIEDLLQESVKLTGCFWSALQSCLETRDLTEISVARYGESLSFGIYGASADSIKFLSSTGLALPGLDLQG